MVSHRCNKCRWFDKEHKSLDAVPGDYGYCRKHKPVVYHLNGRYYGGWPLVDVKDLCGEFRAEEGVG